MIESRLLELKRKADEYNRARQENVYKLARWATDDEAAILKGLVSLFDCETVIECGTANGWSALWFAAAGCKVKTFDPHNRPKIWDAPFQTDDEITCISKDITYYDKPFEEHHKRVLQMLNERRCWFLDGDHDYSAVKRDWDTVISTIEDKATGYFDLDHTVIFHDIMAERGVRKLWKEIREEHPEFHLSEFYSRRGVGVVRCK